MVSAQAHVASTSSSATGDPLRTNAYVFAQNGRLGFPVGKKIALPAAWDELLAKAGR